MAARNLHVPGLEKGAEAGVIGARWGVDGLCDCAESLDVEVGGGGAGWGCGGRGGPEGEV